MARPDRFAGWTVVVTGGAGGIGREVCSAFAAEGANVVSMDVAGSGATFEVDVRDAAAVREAMHQAYARNDRLDVLVTLAGGSLGTPRDLEAIEEQHVDLVVDVNLKGTLYCCQAAMPYLVAAGTGSVVTVSSIGGRQPSPVTGVPYAAAKAGVLGLTRRLAAELGPLGVRVNSVAPGLFLTGRLQRMYDEMPEAERARVLEAIALGRFPEIREVVDPILFLASDEASYVTGAVLDVNGGRFMPL